MVKVYYDADCNMDLLKGKTVAIIGYGSQGHAHALNLKDSGVNVVVGLRPGSKSRAKAEEAGLTVLDTAEAAKAGDVIMILTPDQDQPDIYKKDIEPNLEEGNMLMFAHGFSSILIRSWHRLVSMLQCVHQRVPDIPYAVSIRRAEVFHH